MSLFDQLWVTVWMYFCLSFLLLCWTQALEVDTLILSPLVSCLSQPFLCFSLSAALPFVFLSCNWLFYQALETRQYHVRGSHACSVCVSMCSAEWEACYLSLAQLSKFKVTLSFGSKLILPKYSKVKLNSISNTELYSQLKFPHLFVLLKTWLCRPHSYTGYKTHNSFRTACLLLKTL